MDYSEIRHRLAPAHASLQAQQLLCVSDQKKVAHREGLTPWGQWIRMFSGLASGGSVMPAYEYTCLKCKKNFSVIMTLREYEQGKVKCPKCKSSQVEQKLAAFFAVTSKKS